LKDAMVTTGLGIDWFRYAGSVLVVLLLLLGLLWVLKKMKSFQRSNSANSQMQLLETINIGPRQKISLLRVGSKQVLVGITASQFTALGSWAETETATGDDLVA